MPYKKYGIMGGWLPDYPAHEMPDGGLTRCENVIPTATKYVPMPTALDFSTNAVSGTPLTATAARRGASVYSFFSSTTGLYVLDSTGVLVNISRPAGYNTGARETWRFAQYSNWLIATNYSDPVQVLKDITCTETTVTITRAGGTATVTHTAHGYATNDTVVILGADQSEYNGRQVITVTGADTYTYPVSGSPATPATGTIKARRGFQNLGGTPPRARYVEVIKEYVVLGYLYESSTLYESRVRWSALANPEDWTSSLSTGADKQDVADIRGTVHGLRAYSDGYLIFSEDTVTPAEYIGGSYTFSITGTMQGIGTNAAGSAVSTPQGVYFWSNDDICLYSSDGYASMALGLRRSFFDALNSTHQGWAVQAAHDPVNKVIFWAYPNTGSDTGQVNKILAYCYEATSSDSSSSDSGSSSASQGKYAIISLAAPGLAYIQTNLYVDNADFLGYVDALTHYVDSRIFMPDGMALACLDPDTGKVKLFLGTSMTGVLETGELNGGDDKVYLCGAVKVLAEGATSGASVRVGHRMNTLETASYSDSTTLDDEGAAYLFESGRFFTAEVTLTGHLGVASLMIDFEEVGER